MQRFANLVDLEEEILSGSSKASPRTKKKEKITKPKKVLKKVHKIVPQKKDTKIFTQESAHKSAKNSNLLLKLPKILPKKN